MPPTCYFNLIFFKLYELYELFIVIVIEIIVIVIEILLLTKTLVTGLMNEINIVQFV